VPKEIFPSSYRCDCGYQTDHFENTIRELKQMSMRRPQRLGSNDGEHAVVFSSGKMTAMWCPKVGKDIPANEPPQATVARGGSAKQR
jgi:hypothetical protein